MDANVVGSTKLSPETLTGTVKHLAGVLWYDVLSTLNKTGFGADALGPGNDSFQSLFMWNIAQNDFGAYDREITDAALRQLGGAAPADGSIAPTPPLAPAAADAGTGAPSLGALSMAAAPAAAEPATGPWLEKAKAFARAVWPGLTQAAAALGVPPVGLLAQAALETRWGTSTQGNNLFGIKASPGQPSSWQPTHEMQGGVLVPTVASFRAYGSAADSIADYVREIRSVFPQAANQTSVAGFAGALQAGGYATDRNYAAKIIDLAGSPLMAAALGEVDPTMSTTHSTENPTK
jgi:flagellar protein FlgJ